MKIELTVKQATILHNALNIAADDIWSAENTEIFDKLMEVIESE